MSLNLELKFVALVFVFLASTVVAIPLNGSAKGELLAKLHKFDEKEKDLIVNNLKVNNLSDIEPANHIDALPMEADGSLNKDLHKELFLSDHLELESLNEEQAGKKIEEIFRKADTNNNDALNSEEIENWILLQINLHLDDAVNRNKKMFQYIDTDKDNLIYWTEYYGVYERIHKMHNDSKDEPEDLDGIKRELSMIRERWTNADTDNDDALNLEEFLSFRHPETNGASLRKLVLGLLSSMDKDSDGSLSLQEFLYIPADVDLNMDDGERDFLKVRKEEFLNMDRDLNNHVDAKELQDYLNPHNPRLVKSHVKEIFEYVDNDKNNLIDLPEMMQNLRFFMDSKFINAGDFVHEDL